MAPSPFKPFLIGNQRTGLDLALDPWLLPPDAYTVLDDCYLYNGRIEKRLGQSVLAGLDNRVWDTDHQQLVVDGSGNAVTDPLVNTTLPIVGLFQYESNLGNLQLIALTEQRLFSFIPSLGVFIDMAGENVWSGGDADFFHADTWNNQMFIVNGVDPLTYYDGTHVFPVKIDPFQTGANTITGVLFCFVYYDRLVLLNTIETVTNIVNGLPVTTTTRIPQQARWCDVNNPASWSPGNFNPAPTQDIIVGAAMLNGVLTVFFNKSTWVLLYTGNYQLPFEWVRIPGVTGGAVGKKAVLAYMDQALAIGPTRITRCDGIQCSYVDTNIPQFISNMNPALLKYCYGLLEEKYSRIWLTYPSAAATTYPDKALAFNFDDNSWSTFNFSQSCLGLWSQTFNQGLGAVSAGYPQLVAGTRDGRVLLLNNGGTDLGGAPITASILTGQINPFVKQSRRCWLGWIDLLVNTSVSGLINVSVYGDGYPVAYSAFTGIPLTDGKGGAKSFLRIPVNSEMTFHQVQITHSTADQLVIHAMIPYAKPGGRIYG